MYSLISLSVKNDNRGRVSVSVLCGGDRVDLTLAPGEPRKINLDKAKEGSVIDVHIGQNITTVPTFQFEYSENGAMITVIYDENGKPRWTSFRP